jgi:hypothetical protein
VTAVTQALVGAVDLDAGDDVGVPDLQVVDAFGGH